MNWRNAVDNGDGTYDCEVEMSGGWYPFTANQADPEQHGRDIWQAIHDAPSGDWTLGVLVGVSVGGV